MLNVIFYSLGNVGDGHADALYEGFKLMRWGQLCWFHHLQPSPPVRRGWIVSLENVAGEESVKYRGYFCTSTTKKKRLHYIFKFSTPASSVLPSDAIDQKNYHFTEESREYDLFLDQTGLTSRL